MKAFVVRAPGGLDRLEVIERPDPGEPGLGEIRVALHATSLNYHDLLIASGRSSAADGRVLMSDGPIRRCRSLALNLTQPSWAQGAAPRGLPLRANPGSAPWSRNARRS